FRRGTTRLNVVDERSKPRTLAAADLVAEPHAVGSVELPVPYNPNNRAFQHEVGDALRRARLAARRHGVPEASGAEAPDDARWPAEEHPVAACPDRDAHVRASVQAERVERELHDLRRQVRGRTESLARR